jgi:ABC-type glycerol-3-phosphate transport system permease component
MATIAGTGTRPTAARRPQRPTNGLGQAGKYLLLILFLIVFLVPLIWVLLSAFKAAPEITRNPFGLPAGLAVGEFRRGVDGRPVRPFPGQQRALHGGDRRRRRRPLDLRRLRLALLPLPGRDGLLVLFLLGLMVPFQSFMIPLYYLLRDIRLLETYWAFILPGSPSGCRSASS